MMEPTPKVGETGTTVAIRLRQIREERRLTVRELSERTAAAGRPIHASSIVKIEARARRIDLDDLAVLAAGLAITPTELLTGVVPCRPKRHDWHERPGRDGGIEHICQDCGMWTWCPT